MAFNKSQTKKQRKNLGALCKSKDPLKPPYITIDAYNAPALIGALTRLGPKEKLYLNLDAPQQELKDIAEKRQSGKISDEFYETLKTRLEKIPEFVLFQVSISVEASPEASRDSVPF